MGKCQFADEVMTVFVFVKLRWDLISFVVHIYDYWSLKDMTPVVHVNGIQGELVCIISCLLCYIFLFSKSSSFMLFLCLSRDKKGEKFALLC